MLAEDAAAMRGKRQRHAALALGPVSGGDLDRLDEPAPPVDPSLMTERQQLAFLLRATAQDASSGADDSASSGDSEDERPRRRPKRKAHDEDAPAVKRARRGRPPKAQHKQPARCSPRLARQLHAFPTEDGENRAANANSSSPKTASSSDSPRSPKLKLKQPSSPPPQAAAAAAASRRPLSSPAAFDTCALCGGAPFDALFLCPACDRKYPTQQALGRMCMT